MTFQHFFFPQDFPKDASRKKLKDTFREPHREIKRYFQKKLFLNEIEIWKHALILIRK
jgi:hypothetical protein